MGPSDVATDDQPPPVSPVLPADLELAVAELAQPLDVGLQRRVQDHDPGA